MSEISEKSDNGPSVKAEVAIFRFPIKHLQASTVMYSSSSNCPMPWKEDELWVQRGKIFSNNYHAPELKKKSNKATKYTAKNIFPRMYHRSEIALSATKRCDKQERRCAGSLSIKTHHFGSLLLVGAMRPFLEGPYRVWIAFHLSSCISSLLH